MKAHQVLRLGLNGSGQILDLTQEIRVGLATHLDAVNGIHNGAVILAAEGVTDFNQG